jgi:hypothetical protein
MLNQEATQTDVPGGIARARGQRRKCACPSQKAADDARMPFYGLC